MAGGRGRGGIVTGGMGGGKVFAFLSCKGKASQGAPVCVRKLPSLHEPQMIPGREGREKEGVERRRQGKNGERRRKTEKEG